MPRPKKDGKVVNLYLDRAVVERLERYCTLKGQTKTMAVERILTKAFDKEGIVLPDTDSSEQ